MTRKEVPFTYGPDRQAPPPFKPAHPRIAGALVRFADWFEREARKASDNGALICVAIALSLLWLFLRSQGVAP